jgi:5-bromo-4-chloroindolyl phosphate hydrolysis protein
MTKKRLTDVLIIACFSAVFIGVLLSPIIPIAVKNTMKAHGQIQTQNQTSQNQTKQQGLTTEEINSARKNISKIHTYTKTMANIMDLCFSQEVNFEANFHQCMKVVNSFDAHMESLFKEQRKIINQITLGSTD